MRAAVFRWSTPLETARSTAIAARLTSVRAASPDASPRAIRVVFTAAFILDRTALLRSRRCSFCRILFRAERVFANQCHPLPSRFRLTFLATPVKGFLPFPLHVAQSR